MVDYRAAVTSFQWNSNPSSLAGGYTEGLQGGGLVKPGTLYSSDKDLPRNPIPNIFYIARLFKGDAS